MGNQAIGQELYTALGEVEARLRRLVLVLGLRSFVSLRLVVRDVAAAVVVHLFDPRTAQRNANALDGSALEAVRLCKTTGLHDLDRRAGCRSR